MRRKALVVYPDIYSAPVAVFAIRSDGSLEEASVPDPTVEEIHRVLRLKMDSATWEDAFYGIADRRPRPYVCDVVELAEGISPAEFLDAVR